MWMVCNDLVSNDGGQRDSEWQTGHEPLHSSLLQDCTAQWSTWGEGESHIRVVNLGGEVRWTWLYSTRLCGNKISSFVHTSNTLPRLFAWKYQFEFWLLVSHSAVRREMKWIHSNWVIHLRSWWFSILTKRSVYPIDIQIFPNIEQHCERFPELGLDSIEYQIVSLVRPELKHLRDDVIYSQPDLLHHGRFSFLTNDFII